MPLLTAIQRWFSALTPRHRTLTLVLLLGGISAIALWSQSARQEEMQPLINQPLSAAQISKISAHLARHDIPSRLSSDNRILIPADRRLDAFTHLSYAQLLPEDVSDAFDDMVKQMSHWDSSAKTNHMFQQIKARYLEQQISGYPDVYSARVLIDATIERRIGVSVAPSATIDIRMREGRKADLHLTEAARNAVAGAQAGLSKDRISVIVDGVPQPGSDDASPVVAGAQRLEYKLQCEQQYGQKIRSALPYIPGVIVSVAVELNDPDAPRIAQSGSAQAEQTQTVANIATSIEPAPNKAALAASAHQPASWTENVTSVSVAIPQSYVIGIYHQAHGHSAPADEGALTRIEQAQVQKVRRIVRGSTGIDDSAIAVETYFDAAIAAAPPAAATDALAQPLSSMPLLASLRSHAIEWAIGAAAGIVFIALLMLRPRRSAPAPRAGHDEDERPPRDSVQDDSNEELLDRVREMVNQDPDNAATLVQRWLSTS